MNVNYINASKNINRKSFYPPAEIMIGELVQELLYARRCINRRTMISRLLLRLENVTCPTEAIYYVEILNIFEKK